MTIDFVKWRSANPCVKIKTMCVELKSGGPIMSVGGYVNGSDISCNWFDCNLQCHEHIFNEKQLNIVLTDEK